MDLLNEGTSLLTTTTEGHRFLSHACSDIVKSVYHYVRLAHRVFCD